MTAEFDLRDAAERGDLGKLKALIANGANVNNSGGYRGTALNLAAMKGQHECVKILIAAGADLNVVDGGHRTPIISATERGCSDCVNALILAGADLEVQDHLSETALMKAADRGYVECVKLLVGAGADVNAREKQYYHKTAMDRAHPSVKRILRAAAAKTTFGLMLDGVAYELGITAIIVALRRK